MEVIFGILIFVQIIYIETFDLIFFKPNLSDFVLEKEHPHELSCC